MRICEVNEKKNSPSEVVQLLKNGYATIYENASPSRREGREVRAGRGRM